MLWLCEYSPSPVGTITMVSDGDGLIGLWLEGQNHFMGKISGPVEKNEDLPLFALCRNWLDAYFAGQAPELKNIPLKPQGSEFQKKVWQALLVIPYGKTVTYADISREIGCKSAQAVGGAAGRNPISILIPCHRVIGSGGSLTGYAGGLHNKEILLTIEKSHPA